MVGGRGGEGRHHLVYPPIPTYCISNSTKAAGVESDLLDWILPSSDLYAQPVCICHRW